MNDMNQEVPDQLGASLSSAAESIDVGDRDAMLSNVRGAVATRRRRRTAVMGVAAAGTLVVSGVVIANLVDNNGEQRLQTAPDSAVPTTEAADEDDEDEVDDGPPETAVVPVPDSVATAGEPIPVEVVPVDGSQVFDPAYGEGDAAFAATPQLFAWHDGFLTIRTDYPPQPLPAELPQEIVDQFSQEVIDLFADGLPATIDEATAMLQEAGLFDEVSQVVVDNPDVYEAIYASGPVPEVSARFSTDGVEWSDVELALPPNATETHNMFSTGDRLVMVVDQVGPVPPGTVPPSERPGMEVHSTTDLINWTTQTIPREASAAETSPYVSVDSFAEGVVATADRWVIRVTTFTDVDPFSLMDDDVRERAEAGGYGSSWDDGGITIEVYSDAPVPDGPPAADETLVTTEFVEPEPAERIRFTWDELGLNGPPNGIHDDEPVIWTSNWIDPPVKSAESASAIGRHYLVALDAGFATSGESSVSFSADGVTWTAADLPVAGYIEGLIPVGDAVVAFVSDPGGEQSQHRLDPSTMTWTALDVPGLPDAFSVDRAIDSAATLYEFNEGAFPGAPTYGTRATADVDGYHLEMTYDYDEDTVSVTYVLTDAATGDVVSTETSADVDSLDSPFEFADEQYDPDGTEGLVFSDPPTGEVLVTVPFEAMTFVNLDADGAPVETVPLPPEEEPSPPDYWLVATDGTSWIVDQLGDDNGDPISEYDIGPEVASMAVNNGVIMLGRYDGSLVRYVLP